MLPTPVDRQGAPLQQQQQQQQPRSNNGNNRSGSNRGPVNNLRSAAATEDLVKQLMVVFPDNEGEVRRVIRNHPTEQDPNKLSAFVLHVI